MKRILLAIGRVLRTTAIILTTLLFVGLALLRSKWVQNRLIPIVESVVENATGAEVKIGMVDIAFPLDAVLRDVKMYDLQGKEMFAVESVRASMLDLPILGFILNPKGNKKIRISGVYIDHPEAYLYRSRRDSTLNLDFLTKRSSEPKKKSTSTLEVFLPNIHIHQGRFRYQDFTKPDSLLQTGKNINFANMDVGKIQCRTSVVLGADGEIYGDLEHFQALEAFSGAAIQDMQSDFLVRSYKGFRSGTQICLDQTEVKAGRTQLDFDGSLDLYKLEGDSLSDLWTDLYFRPSKVDFAFLSYLSPKPIPLANMASIKGPLSGDLQKLESDSLTLGIGKESDLYTRLTLTDFTRPEKLAWEIDFLPHSVVQQEDVQKMLAGANYPLRGHLNILGTIKGNLRRIKSRELRISNNQQTSLLVDVRAYEYTNPESMILDLRFDNSQVNIQELHEILPEVALPDFLYNFGKLGLNGNFIGGIRDFVVNADFNSPIGKVRSNLHLLTPHNGQVAYNGSLTTENLNVEALNIDSALIGTKRLNFKGNVNGFGTTFGEANLKVKGKVTQSQILGYDLDTLLIPEITLYDSTLKGYLDLHDENGSAHAYLRVRPKDKQRFALTFQGNIDSLELDHYGLMEKPYEYSGIVDVKLDGSDLEDVTGRAKLFANRFWNQKDSVGLTLDDDFYVRAVRNDSIKEIRLDGGLIEGTVTGHFYFKEGQALVERLVKEVSLFVQNNREAIEEYYQNKVIKLSEDLIEYDLTTRGELNQVLSFFEVPLRVAPGATIQGNFTGLKEDLLVINILADSLRYDNITLRSPDFQVGLVKPAKKNKIQGGGAFFMKQADIAAATFEQVDFSFEVDSNKVDYELDALDPKIGSEVRLLAQTTFTFNGIFSKVNPNGTFIKVKEDKWEVREDNYISIYQYPRFQIEVSNLVFREGSKKVGFQGVASDRSDDTLTVDIVQLALPSIISYFSDSLDMGGKITGLHATLPAILGDEFQVIFKCYADQLSYGEGIDSVRAFAKGSYNNKSNRLVSLAQLGYQENDAALVLYAQIDMDPLKLDIESLESDIPLSWATPFTEGFVSKIKGEAVVDKFRILGHPSNLSMEGDVTFKGTEFRFDMFNNKFRIAENSVLHFDKSRIDFPGNGLIITDTLGHPAVVHGNLTHSGPGAPLFDIRIDTIRNMTVMNTFRSDESPYYGHMRIASGTARITGDADLINVVARVTTGKETRLNIPIVDYTSASRLEFVEFVGAEKTIKVKDSIETKISGLNLDLRVQATPDATVRLIFDEQTGDVIEAKGGGNIGLLITPDGDFEMDGSYELTDGNYLFTVSNVVSKRFRVKPGSRITWNGAPYDAQLKVDAVYAVKANLGDLLAGTSTSSKVPVFVIMHMTGSLLAPSISLELQLDELAGEDVAGLASYFRNIQYDEQELNRQVVSLLVLGKFAPPSSGNTDGNAATAGVTSSLSELVSNQLNNWISQAFDSNLGVELNTNNFEDVELGFKYSFLDDRVTIERNGTLIGNQTGRFSIGDLSMQIKILPASDSTGELKVNQGQLVFEIFNRENPGLNNNVSITSGGGIFYKKDFDRLLGIFRKKEY